MKNESKKDYSNHWYAKANNKCMKDYDIKKSSYPKYLDVDSLHGWAMSQKLPLNNFEWIKNTSPFNDDFTKNHNEESDEGYFLKVDVQYPEKVHELNDNYYIYQKEWILRKYKRLFINCMIKLNMSFT